MRNLCDLRRPFITFSMAVTALIALAACSQGGSPASNVQVTSPTVDPQGSLSLHATATFEASVKDPNGLHEAGDLRYHWTLDTDRGTYLLDGGTEATEAETTTSSIQLRGDVQGEETVRVTVTDSRSDTTVGVGTLAFNITSPSETSNCFDNTTLFVSYGAFNYSDAIDLETGERTTIAYALVKDVSRDGNWFTGVTDITAPNRVFIQRCDGSAYRYLTDGEHYVISPQFSPDGRSVYYQQRSADENVLHPGKGLPGYMELMVVDVDTGVSTALTELNKTAEGSGEYAISPDGETIVFEHFTAALGGLGFVYEFDLVTMPAGGGPLNTLTPLGDYVPVYGIDWSPDGDDIIFSWNAASQPEPIAGEDGIYRIHPTSGGEPQLIFPDPSPHTHPPTNPTYYAGGTRIAWSGQDYGLTTSVVWGIDANGADVQQLTEAEGRDRLMTVWDPY